MYTMLLLARQSAVKAWDKFQPTAALASYPSPVHFSGRDIGPAGIASPHRSTI